jgi:ATP-binding cassette, subfamily B, bacterial
LSQYKEQLIVLPDSYAAALRDASLDPDSLIFAADIDLSRDRTFGHGWVCLTEDKIIVLEGADPARVFTIADLEEIKAENLVTSGLISAKVGGKEEVLCRFSSGRTRDIAQLVRIAGKINESEPLEDGDLERESGETECPKCGRRYPDQDRKVCPHCLDKGSIFVRLLGYFSGNLAKVALIFACMAIQAGLELLAPFINGRILYDEVLNSAGKYYGRIGAVFAIMLGVRLLAVLVSVVYGRIVASLSAKVIYKLKTDLFAALQKLSMSFFTRKQTGALMNRVNWDALMLEFFFIEGVPFFVVNVLIIIGISITMLSFNWLLALMVFIPAPILIYLTKILIPKVWRLYSRRYRSRRLLNSVINDSLSGVRVVKAFGREEAEISRFSGANWGLFSTNLTAQRLSSTVFPFFHLIMQTGGFVVWALGGWKVIQGDISFGVLMTFVGYIAMFYRPMQFFTRVIDWWAMCMNSAQRIFEVMDAEPDIVEKIDPVRLSPIEGHIKVEKVTFAYEPNKPVLHDINLSIQPGEMIGLVGHTGAGKSTITNLITRLYDVEEGTIEIDGVNVKDVSMDDLRSQIAIVLQQTYLFAGTVAENIAYAKPDASEDDVLKAAHMANAHDFIVGLGDGYNTLLGRQGVDLSGGERQRLAIARAILKNPRILIFDEATSSVDTETEEKIQNAIIRMVEGRTTIAIAHRLSTLRMADRLFIIDKGKIVEQGDHGELMAMHEKYYDLVSRERKALKVIGVTE